MKRYLSLAIITILSVNVAVAADVTLKTEEDRLSYTLGVQVGEDFKLRGFEVNVDAFAQAIADVLANSSLKLTAAEMDAEKQNFQKKQMKKRFEVAEKNKQIGEAFLAKNKAKAGIKTLANGIQYNVITPGSGAIPTKTDTVSAHYRGTLTNGKEFDSSYNRGQPASFPVGGVIKGWQEVLQLMKVGAKWKVYIPSEFAYGERGAGADIGPNETLIFDIELLGIK